MAVTALSAAVFAVLSSLGMANGAAVVALALLVFWPAVGYAMGWSAGHLQRCHTGLLIPAVAFIVVDGSLWYVNNLALDWMEHAKDQVMGPAPLGEWLLDTDRHHVFDALAIIFACLIAIAVWKKDGQQLFLFGSTCVIFWLVVISLGFLAAAGGLNDIARAQRKWTAK